MAIIDNSELDDDAACRICFLRNIKVLDISLIKRPITVIVVDY